MLVEWRRPISPLLDTIGDESTTVGLDDVSGRGQNLALTSGARKLLCLFGIHYANGIASLWDSHYCRMSARPIVLQSRSLACLDASSDNRSPSLQFSKIGYEGSLSFSLLQRVVCNTNATTPSFSTADRSHT